MSKKNLTKTEIAVQEVVKGKPPKNREIMEERFGNKVLIISEMASFNGLDTPEPDKSHRNNYKNIQETDRRLMFTSNTVHSPNSITGRSHNSIDTLPLSKGCPKESPSIPHNLKIAQQMNQTVKEGMNFFGLTTEQIRDRDHNLSRELNEDEGQGNLQMQPITNNTSRIQRQKKRCQNLSNVRQRSNNANRYQMQIQGGIILEVSRNTSTEERSIRKTVTLEMSSGKEQITDGQHTNSVDSVDIEGVYFQNQQEEQNVLVSNFGNQSVNDVCDKGKPQRLKNTIVALMNFPDVYLLEGGSVSPHGESRSRGSDAKQFATGRLSKVNLTKISPSGEVFDQLTRNRTRSQNFNDSKMLKLRAVLDKAIKMSKTSADKTWNQMSTYERSKIKQKFEEILRNVNIAERKGHSKQVTETIPRVQLIHELNNCLSAQPISQVQRPSPNSPAVPMTFDAETAKINNALSTVREDQELHELKPRKEKFEPNIAQRNQFLHQILPANSNKKLNLQGWDLHESGGSATPKFYQQATGKLSIHMINGVKGKNLNSEQDINPDEKRKTFVKKSQGTETDLLGQPSELLDKPSRRPSSIHINTEKSEILLMHRREKVLTNQLMQKSFEQKSENPTDNPETIQDRNQSNQEDQKSSKPSSPLIYGKTYQIFDISADRFNCIDKQRETSLITDDLQGYTTNGFRNNIGFQNQSGFPSSTGFISKTQKMQALNQTGIQMNPLFDMMNARTFKQGIAQISQQQFLFQSQQEQPEKIVQSTLQAISLSKQYNLIPNKTTKQKKQKGHQKKNRKALSSDLSHLKEPLEPISDEQTLQNYIKQDIALKRAFIQNYLQVIKLQKHIDESQEETSADAVEYPRTSVAIEDPQPLHKQAREIVSQQQLQSQPSEQQSGRNATDQLSSKLIDQSQDNSNELQKLPIKQSPTNQKVAIEQELIFERAKLLRTESNTKTSSPRESRIGIVHIQSETEKSELFPQYMVSKLGTGNSDLFLQTKQIKLAAGQRGVGKNKLTNRAYGPQNPKPLKKSVQKERQESKMSQTIQKKSQFTGWDSGSFSPANVNLNLRGFNKESTADLLIVNPVQTGTCQQQGATDVKLLLLESRLAEHGLSPSSGLVVGRKQKQLSPIGKLQFSQLMTTVALRRSDLKVRKVDQAYQTFKAAQQLDEVKQRNQQIGFVKGVKKDLNNFTKINRNSALYTMPMMQGTNSRLTAKQNDTEVADSHQNKQTCIMSNDSSDGQYMKQQHQKLIELEPRTIDTIKVQKNVDDERGSPLKSHMSSYDSLHPSFPPNKISMVKLEVSPSAKNEINVDYLKEKLSIGQNSYYRVNMIAEEHNSSSRSPFKMQACQANANTPSNQSENELQIGHKQGGISARPQKRNPIQSGALAAAAMKKLNHTAEGWNTHQNQNDLNAAQNLADCLNSSMGENDEEPLKATMTQLFEVRPSTLEALAESEESHHIQRNDRKDSWKYEERSSGHQTAMQKISNQNADNLVQKNVGNRSQSLAPPVVNQTIRTEKIKNKTVKTSVYSPSHKPTIDSTQPKQVQPIFSGELQGRIKQLGKKVNIRTPLEKLLTQAQMDQFESLIGAKTHRRQNVTMKALLQLNSPENIQTTVVQRTDDFLIKQQIENVISHQQKSLGFQSNFNSPVLNTQVTPTVENRRLPNLKVAALNNTDTRDSISSSVYSKKHTADHVKRLNKIAASIQGDLIFFDPSAGQIRIEHKTSQPFSPTANPRLTAKEKNKMLSTSPTLHGTTQYLQKTLRNSPFQASGPFQFTSPNSTTNSHNVPPSTSKDTEPKMPYVPKRYRSRPRNTETFIFNNVNNWDNDNKKNYAIVKPIFQSVQQSQQ